MRRQRIWVYLLTLSTLTTVYVILQSAELTVNSDKTILIKISSPFKDNKKANVYYEKTDGDYSITMSTEFYSQPTHLPTRGLDSKWRQRHHDILMKKWLSQKRKKFEESRTTKMPVKYENDNFWEIQSQHDLPFQHDFNEPPRFSNQKPTKRKKATRKVKILHDDNNEFAIDNDRNNDNLVKKHNNIDSLKQHYSELLFPPINQKLKKKKGLWKMHDENNSHENEEDQSLYQSVTDEGQLLSHQLFTDDEDYYLNQFVGGDRNREYYVEKLVHDIREKDLTITPKNTAEKKVLLMLTPVFESPYWWDIPVNYSMTDNNGQPCPESRCVVTYDRSRFAESDAVFFHGRDIRDIDADSLRQLRKLANDQIWIWAFMESPLNLYYDPTAYDNVFDWTSTYKRASNFWTPYYKIDRVRSTNNVKVNMVATKSKLVVALQSVCDTERIKLIKRMKRFIKVDVFGKCASQFMDSMDLPECPQNTDACKRIVSKYKFIMAVENTMCDEYVTEKYYKNGLLSGIVPIVMIPPRFKSRKRYFITGSYINILDFPTTKSLTRYLKYLDNNQTAYNQYFRWKDKYEIKIGPHRACLVCEQLWNNKGPNKRSLVKKRRVNLTSFWSTSSCNAKELLLKKYIGF